MYVPICHSVADAFISKSEISGDIIAWDGGTIFNYDKKRLEAGGPRSQQHTWYKYLLMFLGM